MLRRFLELEEPIRGVLDNENCKQVLKNKAASVRLTSNDWRVIQSIVSVLKAFKEATEVLSKADACVSQSIPTVRSVLITLEPLPSDREARIIDLKKRLKENLESRTVAMESQAIYSVVTLLDVRFKGYFFRDQECLSCARRMLINLVKAEIDKDERYVDPVEEEIFGSCS